MLDRPPRYRAYLLRFWQERRPPAAGSAWRFSLEDPHTGERQGFAGLEALLAYLQAEMDSNTPLQAEEKVIETQQTLDKKEKTK